MNKAMLIGRLGKDPEIRYTPSGSKVASVSLATTRRWKDSQGVKQEASEWHRLVIWGKLAEIFEEYTVKGSQVYVSGRIETTSFEKDGVKRYETHIVVDELELLGSKGSASSGAVPADGQEVPSVARDNFDDDIPF